MTAEVSWALSAPKPANELAMSGKALKIPRYSACDWVIPKSESFGILRRALRRLL